MGIIDRLQNFVTDYSFLFQVGLKNVRPNIERYLQGLFQRYKARNIERMIEVVDADYQSLHHTITDSPWDARPVMDLTAQKVDQELGDNENACLIIDPSSFRKWGNNSIGVAKQWCGRLGKVENCQVGVFAALANGVQAALIDARLYLPKSWTDDTERCLAAKVPEEEIRYRKRTEIAREIVEHADEIGVRYGWVLADAEFSRNLDFCACLDASGKRFVVDIAKDTTIYLDRPEKDNQKGVRVEHFFGAFKRNELRNVRVRTGSKGIIISRVGHARAWVNDSQGRMYRWHILFLQDEAGNKHYAVSNAHNRVSAMQLARIHAQRVWIETSFRDAKSAVGMDEYQVRGWVGWHHHMALCMMALLFILKERRRQNDTIVQLSATDVTNCISMFLLTKVADRNEVLRQLNQRHQQRLRAQCAHARRCRLKRRLRRLNQKRVTQSRDKGMK